MVQPAAKKPSVGLLADPFARLLIPEYVYAATFLFDGIYSSRVPPREQPLMDKAHREIQNGDVSEQTLDRLVTLQPTRRETAVES